MSLAQMSYLSFAAESPFGVVNSRSNTSNAMAKTTSNWQVIQCHESLHTIRREVKEWKEEKTKDG